MITSLHPDAATGNTTAAQYVTDKRGFALRWGFSVRMIDNLIAQGLPHCKVGARRLRIITHEGDEWMVQRFGTQRRGATKCSK